MNVSCKSGTSPPNNSECIADCAGVCGGSAVLSGCDNTCGSTLENDACDVCGGEITNEFLTSTGHLKGAHEKGCPIYRKILSLNL